jgi:heat shock protein HslJ
MPMMPKLRNPVACAISALALGCAPVVIEPAVVTPPSWAPLTKQALLGSWELTRVSSQPVPRGMSLTFSADGGVRGRMTCGNLLRASYQVFPHRIAFAPITITERGCDSPALLNAAEKTLRLPSSAYLSPDGQRLYIRAQETLEFTRATNLREGDA